MLMLVCVILLVLDLEITVGEEEEADHSSSKKISSKKNRFKSKHLCYFISCLDYGIKSL